MDLIEQSQYLIYDSEVYFCVQNFVKPESLFQCVEVNEKQRFSDHMLQRESSCVSVSPREQNLKDDKKLTYVYGLNSYCSI